MKSKYDAVVIGSGPNGYAAAITLAQKNYSVLIIEGENSPGGGMRTEERTIPGFMHDVCSTMHPMGIGSPFFSSIPLEEHGLKWIYPPVFLAHPFDDGSAAILLKSVEETAALLEEDETKYLRLMKPFAEKWSDLASDILGPIKLPRHPITLLKFGLNAIRSNNGFIKKFDSYKTKALFTGLAAHGVVPTNQIFTAAVGLVLGILAHARGWPYSEGGSVNLTRALDSYFRSLGGEVITGSYINSFDQIPPSRTILFDTSPVSMLKIMGSKLSDSYRRKIKKFKYGPAAYKIDFAVSDPVPFKNEFCRQSGFLHIGGRHTEVIESEKKVFNNQVPDNPFLLFAQPTLFDKTRSPAGKHIAYAYCHVPNSYKGDLTEKIISQIERFAPGFRDTILAKSVMTPADLEKHDPNYIGGDINGGMQSWDQLFTRPVKKINPYKTPADGVYICSSSTPPGGGVHGMCGYYAAKSAEKYLQK